MEFKPRFKNDILEKSSSRIPAYVILFFGKQIYEL